MRGYAFVKDHKILEIATHPSHPQALRALLGRVRAEALERAYPEVIVHAPAEHPVLEAFRAASGRVIDQEEYEGTCSMYHIPDIDRFLKAILPELSQPRGGGRGRPSRWRWADRRRPPLAAARGSRGEPFARGARQAQPPPSDPDARPRSSGWRWATPRWTSPPPRKVSKPRPPRRWTPLEFSSRAVPSGGARSTAQRPTPRGLRISGSSSPDLSRVITV